MASKNDNRDDSIRIDQNALLGEMENFTGATRHIKAAGYGLAAPLSTLRLSQMRAERARAVARYGETSETVANRTAQLDAATIRTDALTAEFNRTLVDPPKPDIDRNQAGVYGRVIEAGAPKPDLIVGAVDDKDEWQGHTCTGPRGDFAFSTTANIPLRLVVTEKSGAPLYRDQTERTYAPGQVVWREIDLAITEKPCDTGEGGNGEEPEPELVVVPPLVGLAEADAVDTLRKEGLVRGDRSTRPDEDNVGKVVEQDPESGSEVERGSAVAIVVGVSQQILMPDVVGAPINIAKEKLSQLPHQSIDIEEEVEPNRVGIVVAQVPDKDTILTDGTQITLTVGINDRMIMPRLIGNKREEAVATLTGLGITKIEFSQRTDPQSVGLVVDQDPQSGKTIETDTSVSLVIGVRGNRPDFDTDHRFDAVLTQVAADDRFAQLRIDRDRLEQVFKDNSLAETAELRRLSKAQPAAIRSELRLSTLNSAKLLRTLLRAAFKKLDEG